MALTHSSLLPLGTPLPPFELENVVSGALVASVDFDAQPLVVAVICNHCPFVRHIQPGLVALGRWLREREVACIAVSANDPTTHPDDGPDAMAKVARALAYPFPYLFDTEQKLVRALGAECTPEFYVFDPAHRLVYRGRLDAARPGSDAPSDGHDVRAAVERLLAGQPPLEQQEPSIGCSIKWRTAR